MAAEGFPAGFAGQRPLRGQDPAFLRLWQGFLNGRVVVGLALVLLQFTGQMLNQTANLWIIGVCVLYLASTLALRMLAGKATPAPHAGMHWLPSIGVDLAVVSVLQLLHTGNMSFTPLFGLPILMASVLGTLTLALGTTAAVTLLLLAWAWWGGDAGSAEAAQRSLQAALTGTGYFIVAFLVQQLAGRLVREQHIAETSRATALVQRQVSALVMQNLSEGVLVLDDQFVVRNANPAGVRLLGAEATLTPPFSLLARPAWQALAALARRSFRQDAPQVADVNLISDDQSPIGLHVRTWLTAPGSAAPEASQQRLCVVFLHDLRELEARLRTEKLAAMGRMSAAVAHEIRNPLAAIMQANALLDEDLTDPGQKQLALMVRQNAQRLARIAEEVLDIARVRHQAGQTEGDTLVLDDSVTALFTDWARTNHAAPYVQTFLKASDSVVVFEADHLRRVLVNLLDNALRYIGKHADSLQISTGVATNGQAGLQVWSDGPPLEKTVERHLFEPFFSSESRSSGLGLYICRELCERHGASIAYQRIPRHTARGLVEGNAFSLVFRPAQTAHAADVPFDTPLV